MRRLTYLLIDVSLREIGCKSCLSLSYAWVDILAN